MEDEARLEPRRVRSQARRAAPNVTGMGTGPPSPYDDGTTRSGFEDARTREGRDLKKVPALAVGVRQSNGSWRLGTARRA
jgi:hypothetical protein